MARLRQSDGDGGPQRRLCGRAMQDIARLNVRVAGLAASDNWRSVAEPWRAVIGARLGRRANGRAHRFGQLHQRLSRAGAGKAQDDLARTTTCPGSASVSTTVPSASATSRL
jgi:hypothetical protein